jgi:hypothetical protein
LEGQLHWLQLSHDQGRLTEQEYARARQAAISAMSNAWIDPQYASEHDAHWLHDELGFLSLMKQEGEITPEEFGPARDIIVARYRP